MAKTTITQSEYYQLVGLLTLAASYEQKLKDIEKAAGELLDVPPESANAGYYGHVSDAVYGSRGPDELLQLLKITVWDPATA